MSLPFVGTAYTPVEATQESVLPPVKDLVPVEDVRTNLFTNRNVLPPAVDIFTNNNQLVLATTLGGVTNLSTPQIARIAERWALYTSLSDVCKGLIQLIYTDLQRFITRDNAHPLEECILAYDDVMGDERMVRAVGSRNGIFVDLDYVFTADDIFISRLVDIILTFQGTDWDTPYVPGTTDLPSMEWMINVNRPEFNQFLLSIGMEPDESLYQDRLYLLASLVRSDR